MSFACLLLNPFMCFGCFCPYASSWAKEIFSNTGKLSGIIGWGADVVEKTLRGVVVPDCMVFRKLSGRAVGVVDKSSIET